MNDLTMLMQLGHSPELTQAAYRIGDSTTNIITPLMPYFPVSSSFCTALCEEDWNWDSSLADVAVFDHVSCSMDGLPTGLLGVRNSFGSAGSI